MNNKRDISTDILRCIGLFMIILAHVNPPGVIAQLRNFDVPLMVFVSGVSFSFSKGYRSYTEYIYSRVKRLVLPVWIFVSMFYLFISLFSVDVFNRFNDIYSYANTLFFKDAVDNALGYTWIIRIFLMLAIIAPLIRSATKSLSQLQVFLSFIIVLILNQMLCAYYLAHDDVALKTIVINYILPCISYGAIFLLGFNNQKFSPYFKCFVSLLAFVTFVFFVLFYKRIHGGFVSTQSFKYPPSGYYISYSIMVIFILSLMMNRITHVVKIMLGKFVVFCSSNSIWIYLWHIPVVEYFSSSHDDHNFLIRYVIACTISLSLMFIQVRLVNGLKEKVSPTNFKHLRDIFTG